MDSFQPYGTHFKAFGPSGDEVHVVQVFPDEDVRDPVEQGYVGPRLVTDMQRGKIGEPDVSGSATMRGTPRRFTACLR
jgi:hypothetical protein